MCLDTCLMEVARRRGEGAFGLASASSATSILAPRIDGDGGWVSTREGGWVSTRTLGHVSHG